MNNYIINKKTMAIKAINENKSIVYEVGKEFEVNKDSLYIIKKSCFVYGSSFKGRVEGSRELIKIKYKVPIIIQEENNIVFFPMKSPRLGVVDWISIKYIKNFYQRGYEKGVFVEFDNGLIINFNVSYSIFKNQFIKAEYLSSKIRKNKQ